MTTQFFLIVQDHAGVEHRIKYQLADNPIAQKWIKKIKHIFRVPLDTVYTEPNDKLKTKEEFSVSIAADISALNNAVGEPVYKVKQEYNQDDCNQLHAFTVANQYSYNIEVRDLLHRLHRKIHRLEMALSSRTAINKMMLAGWGEKGGPITTTHTESPYQYYQLNMTAGNMYHTWTEFGKTPYHYWRDHDIEDTEHLLVTCKPHTTFRPDFTVFFEDVDYRTHIDKEFETWFDKYRPAWEEKYHADELSVYGHGGILLAEPVDDQFTDFTQIHIMKSIDLS